MRVFSIVLMFLAIGSQPPAGPEWPAAASAADGRSLIVAYGCLGCHEIPGFTGVAFRGPTLENAGRKFRPEWLRAWFPGSDGEVLALCRRLNALLEAPEGPTDGEVRGGWRPDPAARTPRGTPAP